MHDEAVDDLVEGLDDRVEVAGPQPDATAVEGGVGATGDRARAVVGERDPVAMPPDPGEVLEVGGAVAAAIGVVPEADGHRRHRRGEHELTGDPRRAWP